MAYNSWLKKFDAFQSLPRELTETSMYGGTYTIVAGIVLAYLFIGEFISFMSSTDQTYIVMNQGDSQSLKIIFDVTMHALPCDHVDIMLFDAFRESSLPVHTSTLTRTPIVGGTLQTTKATTLTHSDKRPDGRVKNHDNHPELDMDWETSSEIMKHHVTFQTVVQGHDFTFINFYADWCVHCRNFAPIWNKAEKETNLMTFEDAEGKELIVKMIRINCVEFAAECNKLHIPYFPNIRLYKSDTHFEIYDGSRTGDALVKYVTTMAGQSHHPDMHEYGTEKSLIQACKLHGELTTLRVPGEFHFQVKAHDKSLVASMTNVSHTIHKLVFADAEEADWNKITRRLGKTMQKNINPLKGQSFITTAPHYSPQHHLQVVTTSIEDKTIVYQLTAQSHTKPEDRTAIPQAKFSYTISPMTVLIHKKYVPFYKFLTSICALLGGAYTLIKFCHSGTDWIVKKQKNNLGKLG